jgi:hypothetical protein
MAVAIASVPATPTAVVSACRIEVTGASANTAAGAELRYYIAILEGSVEKGRSYVFNVSSAGKHDFFTYVFPDAGTYTLELRDAADNSVEATESVTVA